MTKLSKKETFLKSMKGTRTRYKRYRGSPIRYAGGKSLAVGYIIEYLPDNINKVVSPFIGGGSVEIAMANELDLEVIGYDIFDMLVNYWHYQINEPKKLFLELKKLKNTKEEYERIKDELKKHWNREDGYLGGMDDLKRASYYYFNHNLSYGPGFLGWMSSNYLKDSAYNNMLERVKNFKTTNLNVYVGSFEDTIPKHNQDFLYLDPPYYLDGDSKMFKGIYPMRNFPIHHNNFDHELLAKLLKNHKGGFILSYNDCSWVRETFKEYEIIEVKWQYTMGQGETRIGKNRIDRDFDNTNVKKSHELIIIG